MMSYVKVLSNTLGTTLDWLVECSVLIILLKAKVQTEKESETENERTFRSVV